jgi:hypothetical protein
LVTLRLQSKDRSKGLSDEGKGLQGKDLRLGALVRLRDVRTGRPDLIWRLAPDKMPFQSAAGEGKG